MWEKQNSIFSFQRLGYSHSHDWIWGLLDLFWHCIKKNACGAAYYDSSVGGKDSDSDMDMEDDFIYTYTISFSLSFSCSPSFFLTDSLSLVLLFFPLSLVMCVSFTHTHTDLYNPFLNGRMGMEGYVTRCGMRISWYLLFKSTVPLDVWKSTYWFKHTPSHTVSGISTIKQMSRKHPLFEDQISSWKNAEKSRKYLLRHTHFDIVTMLLQKSPPAALRGIQVNVQNMFTTISSKTWTHSQLVTHCSLHGMLQGHESFTRNMRMKKMH